MSSTWRGVRFVLLVLSSWKLHLAIIVHIHPSNAQQNCIIIWLDSFAVPGSFGVYTVYALPHSIFIVLMLDRQLSITNQFRLCVYCQMPMPMPLPAWCVCVCVHAMSTNWTWCMRLASCDARFCSTATLNWVISWRHCCLHNHCTHTHTHAWQCAYDLIIGMMTSDVERIRRIVSQQPRPSLFALQLALCAQFADSFRLC